MTKKETFTLEQALEALADADGHLKIASRRLNTTPPKLLAFFNRDEKTTEQYRGVVLYCAKGSTTTTAKRLGVTPRRVQQMCKESEYLREWKFAGRERRIDMAESQLDREVEKGNITAIIFLLKTIGKGRGYIERTEVGGVDGQPVPIEATVRFVKPE